jgi:hypothetical protein
MNGIRGVIDVVIGPGHGSVDDREPLITQLLFDDPLKRFDLWRQSRLCGDRGAIR